MEDNKVEKIILKIVNVFKWCGIFGICSGIALLIEYGFDILFIGLILLGSILAYTTDVKIKEELNL
jgi:hypothetical protein